MNEAFQGSSKAGGSRRVDGKALKVEEPVRHQAFQLLHIEVDPILSLETQIGCRDPSKGQLSSLGGEVSGF